jgi:hypothetical protein
MTRARAKARRVTRSVEKHAKPGDKATEHYHREKARRERRAAPEDDVMAAARREYLALLESDAVKGKGGRPRKKVAPVTEDPHEVDEGVAKD